MDLPNNFTMISDSLSQTCDEQIKTLAQRCVDFKLQVVSTMNTRFTIALIILSLLIIYQLIIKYGNFEFSKSEKYQRHIDFRIDLAIIILLLSYIAYIFFL